MFNPLTFTSITLSSQGQWTFTWAATGAASYRVVLYGQQIANPTTSTYSFNLPWPNSWPPPLEVCGINDTVWGDLYPSFVVIQWYPALNANFYNVQEFINSAWVQRQRVVDNGLGTPFQINTPVLTDGNTFTYQVVATSSIGQVAPGLTYVFPIVTLPDLPLDTIAVTYTPGSTSIVISRVV